MAKIMVNAVTARRPRPRYRIGLTARIMPAMYRVLPNRTWDRLTGRLFPA
jgi:hypothetical protein